MAQTKSHPETGQEPQASASPAGQPATNGTQPAVTAETAVPERPVLAPNVVLSGAMEESGFAEPQWMVQRDGQFIHLTELLYHVVEQIDGQHTLDEIAAGMSEKIDRNVTPDNVQQLIASKLIPLGVVKEADGSVATDGAGEEGAARSPLKINMKTKVLPRGLITPLTKVLKVLFFPPILLAMLVVCAIAQIWLFFVHGIASSIHEAVYKPWLTLVLLGIIIIGTAWHEFGHAAALEYGGGEVRGMGMGFYLVYPAFYTDVTDNYRLGRWARVRTDLGGFYFNLIFCLGLVGLYALTRQSFLLLGVLLIDADIIHQCLPFVRLDGYWTLADITGIPDFFSYMGPFLRSVLPIKRREGDEKLPELKRWVKILFGLYILITIPVLAFLLFVMLKNVPRILASAWDSFDKQGSALAGAWHGGHYGGVALATLQILLLALPVAGLGFTLFSLGRTLMRLLWNWSKPTPARRVAGSLATAAIAALLVYLWVPNQSFGTGHQVTAGNNWTPIAANERGTVSDALPQAVPVPFRSSTTEPTAEPLQTATSVPNGTPSVTRTPDATVTGTVTGTPTASGTPGATPTRTASTGVPTTTVSMPVPAVQPPPSAPFIVPTTPPFTPASTPSSTTTVSPGITVGVPIATNTTATSSTPRATSVVTPTP